jgi:putative ABC transport system permease protein
MRIQDTAKLATRMFKTRPARTWLTILGIGVGIAAVVVLVGLGYGLQGIVMEKIVFGEAMLSLDVSPADSIVKLDKVNLDKIAKIEHVQVVEPLASYNSLVTFGELTGSGFVRGVNPNYFKYAGIMPLKGSLLSENDKDKIVLSTAALKLFEIAKPEDAIGKRLSFKVQVPGLKVDEYVEVPLNKEYEVVGVVEDESAIYAYIHMNELTSKFSVATYERARAKVDDSAFLNAATQSINQAGFTVTALSKTVEQANKIFSGIQIMLAIFGGIALVVSAIGMFNTMTVTLLERTNEIGIMRTIGGSPTNIQVMFLSESIVMGFFGGLVGIAIGVAGGLSINFALNTVALKMGGQAIKLFRFPIGFLLFIAGFGIVMGFLTGVYPARRAASLNPLDAIRYK